MLRISGNFYHGLFYLLLVFIIPYTCVVIITAVTWIMLLRDRRSYLKKGDNTNNTEITKENNQRTNEFGNENNIHEVNESGMSTEENPTDDEITQTDDEAQEGVSKKRKRRKRGSLSRRAMDKEMMQVTRTITLIIVSFSICVVPYLAVQGINLTPNEGEFESFSK